MPNVATAPTPSKLDCPYCAQKLVKLGREVWCATEDCTFTQDWGKLVWDGKKPK